MIKLKCSQQLSYSVVVVVVVSIHSRSSKYRHQKHGESSVCLSVCLCTQYLMYLIRVAIIFCVIRFFVFWNFESTNYEQVRWWPTDTLTYNYNWWIWPIEYWLCEVTTKLSSLQWWQRKPKWLPITHTRRMIRSSNWNTGRPTYVAVAAAETEAEVARSNKIGRRTPIIVHGRRSIWVMLLLSKRLSS